MLRSSALRSRRGRGIIRIRNAPIFIIAGLSPNITACYLLVRSYRLIGVGHHFDFPSFVPQTSITTVDPSFGLINLYNFISGKSCFFPSTRPTSAASSTAASTPTTRTLSRQSPSNTGIGKYRFCEYEDKKVRSPACCRQKNAIFYLIFTEPGAPTLAPFCNSTLYGSTKCTGSLSDLNPRLS